MKKRLIGLMAALFLILFAGAAIALAQDNTSVIVFGVEIDLIHVDALVALLGGGIVSAFTQIIKKKVAFLSGGVGAFILTLLMTFATTAVYFLLINPMVPWSWITYLIYGAVVLGEATSYFHLYKKVTHTPTTS